MRQAQSLFGVLVHDGVQMPDLVGRRHSGERSRRNAGVMEVGGGGLAAVLSVCSEFAKRKKWRIKKNALDAKSVKQKRHVDKMVRRVAQRSPLSGRIRGRKGR
jgi:hypothetical protein